MLSESEFGRLWSAEQITEWKSRGGRPTMTMELSALGWSGRDCLDAFAGRKKISRDITPPEAPAKYWKAKGGGLADALRDPFPPVAGDSVLRIRRDWYDSSLELLNIWSKDAHFALTRTYRSPDGRWSQRQKALRGGSITEVLARNYRLRECSNRFAVAYQIAQADIPFDEFVLGLKIPPNEPDVDWSANLGVAEHWAGDEFYIADHPRLSRWITVNEMPVTWVLADGKPFPFAANWETDQFAPLVGREIAHWTWFSEGGGGPISWDGGNSVYQLEPGYYLQRQWGDLGSKEKIVVIDKSVNSLAKMLGDWVMEREASVEAAFALQPRPPKPKGRSAKHDAWDSFELVESCVWFDVSDNVETLLRRYLRKVDTGFRLTCDALARPDSKAGRALIAAIETTIEDGELWRLREFPYGEGL